MRVRGFTEREFCGRGSGRKGFFPFSFFFLRGLLVGFRSVRWDR